MSRTFLHADTPDATRFLLAVTVLLIRKLDGEVTVTNEELGQAAMDVLTGAALPAIEPDNREAVLTVGKP